MTYELAKQLKDAGYPQEMVDGSYRHREDREPHEYGCYAPNLSELIEACGEQFHHLTRLHDQMWEAGARDTYYDAPQGHTPEEAVARLWLALNKK